MELYNIVIIYNHVRIQA